MKLEKSKLILLSLVGLTICSGLVLASTRSYADNDSTTDEVNITVPVACTMIDTITTGQEHAATLQPGTYSGASASAYENGIGKTTLTTFCNDYNGFSIYTIGFTDDTEGNNTLLGTSASGSATIPTKVYESTDTTSNWSMKVTKVDDSTEAFNPANMSITNNFDTWHTVPDNYTKVAEYQASTGSSATDRSLGAKLETTYASYISTFQPADTYTGKVKYVIVHPYDATAPEEQIPMSSCPASPMISTVAPRITYMQDIDSSNKASVLASLTTDATYQIKDNRDNETYCIGKLADNNLWLLDNLALDLTNSTVLSGMNESNTNASNATLDYLKGTTTRNPSIDPNGRHATSAITISDSTYSYSDPRVSLAEKDTVPSDAISTAGQYKVGGYYNFCAASAGSYCYGNNTNYGTSSGNATEDICPKGWRMPGGGDIINLTATPPRGEYLNIYNITNYNSYANYRSALHLPLSDELSSGSLGYFWSSTRFDDRSMYDLILTDNAIFPADDDNADLRQYPLSVRCVLGS